MSLVQLFGHDFGHDFKTLLVISPVAGIERKIQFEYIHPWLA
jgi:hypothetical protein